MKDILNKLFSSLFTDYNPEDLLKYLYIGNLIVLTFIFVIMGIEYDIGPMTGWSYYGDDKFGRQSGTISIYVYSLPWYTIPFYLTYSLILGLSYLSCTGKSNFWKLLLSIFFHFNLLTCILFTTMNYDFYYAHTLGIHAPGFLDPIYALPLILYTFFIIIYFIFYSLFPYIVKVYSNSLLGLYLKTKQLKLKKLKSKLREQVKEDD